jgi:16S rRNA (guanine966-N2)-methyltransferase
MRIVAGEFRGRRLVAPAGMGTRPTSDRVRESLFAILGPLGGDRVLDIFAGTGALGIEAISRGAASAVAVDRDRAAVRAIRANAEALDLGDRLRVVQRGWREALRVEAEAGAAFDLVLIDPPYDLLPGIAPTLGEAVAQVLAPGGVVVLEHARGAMMGADGLPGIAVSDETTRRYGDTEITVMWTSGEGT